MAFHVVGCSLVRACLERLGLRECHLGGYNVQRVTFIEQRTTSHAGRLTALVFIASPCNDLYLGPAPVDELARQVPYDTVNPLEFSRGRQDRPVWWTKLATRQLFTAR